MADDHVSIVDVHVRVHPEYTLVTLWLDSTNYVLSGVQKAKIFPPERPVAEILANELDSFLYWDSTVDINDALKDKVNERLKASGIEPLPEWDRELHFLRTAVQILSKGPLEGNKLKDEARDKLRKAYDEALVALLAYGDSIYGK